MNTQKFQDIGQSHPDLLTVTDYEKEITQLINNGEDPITVEKFITDVEQKFLVELFEIRLALAISIYNQDSNKFSKLLAFMKELTNRVLESNKSNNAAFAPSKKDFEKILNILNQIRDQETFYLQLDTLKYGNPLVFGIFTAAKNDKQ
jgi:hypothetical protein